MDQVSDIITRCNKSIHTLTGVDWVLFDWTNNIPCVERCTAQPCMCVGRSDLQMVVDSAIALVDYQVERKRAGLPYLRHATFIGVGMHLAWRCMCFNHQHTLCVRPTHVATGPGEANSVPACQNHNNGMVYRLAESVRAFFLDNPGRREVAFELGGKPLLLWWLGALVLAQ